MPTRIEKFTVNRGPHIDKKSREQFEVRIHKRLIDIHNATNKTIDQLMKLELPHLGPIRLGLFFARLDFDGIRDFFGANDTVFAASIRYNFLDRFYVRFRLVNEHTESGSSQYRTKTDFDFGFGLIIRL